MSFERESTLDPRTIRPVNQQFLLSGYVLGIAAMAPLPLAYYWFFAPLGAVLVAALCLVASLVRPKFGDSAKGAMLAALFGAVVVAVLALNIGQR